MRSEDDMDFMPIIPMNENDNEGLNDIEIPKELPVLPLRNTVLFPGVVLPITVGRDKSIKAVNDAYRADKLIGVLAQKDSNIEDPGVTDLEDGMEIRPSRLTPARIETYDDHRIAMAFSIVGLRIGGVKILNPGCVSKTFPDFFEKLASLTK